MAHYRIGTQEEKSIYLRARPRRHNRTERELEHLRTQARELASITQNIKKRAERSKIASKGVK